jgi:hypothetical protein
MNLAFALNKSSKQKQHRIKKNHLKKVADRFHTIAYLSMYFQNLFGSISF